MRQIQAKKLNQKFNSFIREERDKKKSNYNAEIVVELTGPEYIGGVSRDFNGNNLTVQLIQKTFSTERIQLIASHRSNLLILFFRATAQEKCENFKGAVVTFKNKKGKRDYMTVTKDPYTDDKKRDVNEKVTSRLGFGWKYDIEKSENKNAINKLIDSISDDLCSYATIRAEDREALESMTGVRIEDVMEYTHELMIEPKFMRESKNSILFGWMSFGTYASHPMTLKVTKLKKGIELVRLADFGAESSGYYSHDRKHTCKPEHVQSLESFARSFKILARKAV